MKNSFNFKSFLNFNKFIRELFVGIQYGVYTISLLTRLATRLTLTPTLPNVMLSFSK